MTRPPPSPPEVPPLLVLPPELVPPELVPPLVVPPLVVPPLVVTPLLVAPPDELVVPLPELPVSLLLPASSPVPKELSICGFEPLQPNTDTPVAIVAMPIHRIIFMAPSKDFRCQAARKSKRSTLSAHNRFRTSGTQSALHVPPRSPHRYETCRGDFSRSRLIATWRAMCDC
jgi:hypothetical protein